MAEAVEEMAATSASAPVDGVSEEKSSPPASSVSTSMGGTSRRGCQLHTTHGSNSQIVSLLQSLSHDEDEACVRPYI
jgi:hypothetical protein